MKGRSRPVVKKTCASATASPRISKCDHSIFKNGHCLFPEDCDLWVLKLWARLLAKLNWYNKLQNKHQNDRPRWCHPYCTKVSLYQLAFFSEKVKFLPHIDSRPGWLMAWQSPKVSGGTEPRMVGLLKKLKWGYLSLTNGCFHGKKNVSLFTFSTVTGCHECSTSYSN